MTDYFVSHLGSNTSPYDTMAKAAIDKTTIEGIGGAGDTVFYASDHDGGTTAAYTLLPGVQGNPTRHISINRTTEVEESMVVGGGIIGAVAAGTTEFTMPHWSLISGLVFGVADNMQAIQFNGLYSFRGVTFSVFDNLNVGNTAHKIDIAFIDCDYIAESPAQFTPTKTTFTWIGGTFSFGTSGAVTTALFQSGIEGNSIYVEGVDFQGLDAGDYLVEAPVSRNDALFVGCKVPAAMAGLLTGTIIDSNAYTKFHNVSSDDILIALTEFSYPGIITDETSIYTGASQLSIEFAANTNVVPALDGLEFTIFRGELSANPTLEIEIVADESVALTDSDIWIDIFGPDTTTGVLSKITSTISADNQNPVTLTSSSATWTGTGGFTNEQKRKITKTLSGYQAGEYKIVVVVAKNITAYADIDVTVS